MRVNMGLLKSLAFWFAFHMFERPTDISANQRFIQHF